MWHRYSTVLQGLPANAESNPCDAVSGAVWKVYARFGRGGVGEKVAVVVRLREQEAIGGRIEQRQTVIHQV